MDFSFIENLNNFFGNTLVANTEFNHEKIMDILTPIIAKMDGKLDGLLKQYEDKMNDDMKAIDFYLISFDIILKLLKDNELRNLFFECLKELYDKIEDVLMALPNIDEQLYLNSKELLEKAIKVEPMKCIEKIKLHFMNMEKRIPLEHITNTILIIRDSILRKNDINLEEITLKEFFLEEGEEESSLEPKSFEEGAYNEYFSDFIGKFATIIEGYVKNCMLTIWNLNRIVNNKQDSDLDFNMITIGDVFKRFDTKNKYVELDLWRHIRDACSHFNLILNYEKDWRVGNVLFKTREKETEMSNVDLLNRFIKTLQFIFTFTIALSLTFLKHDTGGQEFGDIILTLIAPNMSEFEEEIKKFPDKSLLELYYEQKQKNLEDKT